MSGRARVVVASVLVALLAACGSGGSGVSKPAGRVLALEVDAIRAAAGSADRTATAQRLAQLRASVTQLRASNGLSAAAAARIRRAATAVDAQLDLLPTTTTTTTTTTTPMPGPRGKVRPDHGDKPRHGRDGGE